MKNKAPMTHEPEGYWLFRVFSENGPLTPQQEYKEDRAVRKLLVDSAKFWGHASPQQQEQLGRLTRWYRLTTYGPALSLSRRRRRALRLVHTWHERCRKDGLGANLLFDEVLTPIFDALHESDHEFFNDIVIAIKFLKRSPVEAYLASYSLMSVGKKPRYTFDELHRIMSRFSDMSRESFRKQIRKLRKEHGDFAIPLRRGKPGRPKKK
jgi:hypothetical protein